MEVFGDLVGICSGLFLEFPGPCDVGRAGCRGGARKRLQLVLASRLPPLALPSFHPSCCRFFLDLPCDFLVSFCTLPLFSCILPSFLPFPLFQGSAPTRKERLFRKAAFSDASTSSGRSLVLLITATSIVIVVLVVVVRS